MDLLWLEYRIGLLWLFGKHSGTQVLCPLLGFISWRHWWIVFGTAVLLPASTAFLFIKAAQLEIIHRERLRTDESSDLPDNYDLP